MTDPSITRFRDVRRDPPRLGRMYAGRGLTTPYTRRDRLSICQRRGQLRDIRTLCPGRWQAVELRSSIKPDLG